MSNNQIISRRIHDGASIAYNIQHYTNKRIISLVLRLQKSPTPSAEVRDPQTIRKCSGTDIRKNSQSPVHIHSARDRRVNTRSMSRDGTGRTQDVVELRCCTLWYYSWDCCTTGRSRTGVSVDVCCTGTAATCGRDDTLQI